jgi:uncharacterized membrane protein (GlpM family)
MHDAVVLIIKGLAGGSLVMAFALLGHSLRPKWFAGLFSAAPSIALAGLIVTVVDKGRSAASDAALGMAFGALGFVLFALCVRPLLLRLHATLASMVGCAVWLLASLGLYELVLR